MAGLGHAGEQPRVIVVEPDPILRALIVRLLDGSGYQPLPTGTRGRPVSLGQVDAEFAVVDADGFEDRCVPQLLVPAVVLTSGFWSPPVGAAGCVEVVKPFRKADLINALRSLSGRAQRAMGQ